MGYVFNYKDAAAYEEWLKSPACRVGLELENRLMLSMLQPRRGTQLLDIGCGSGRSLMPFLGTGCYLTGVDPSPYMLDIARARLGPRVDFHRAYAEDLPFDDNYFHYSCICLTLEFVEDSSKALSEACRVTREAVFVGVFNRYGFKAVKSRVRGIFQPTIFNRARFYSIGDVKHLFRMLLGDVPVYWRTVSQLPGRGSQIIGRLENSGLMHKMPFGAFAGIMAVPVPRFRTMPLALKATANSAGPAGSVISCPGHSTDINSLQREKGQAGAAGSKK